MVSFAISSSLSGFILWIRLGKDTDIHSYQLTALISWLLSIFQELCYIPGAYVIPVFSPDSSYTISFNLQMRKLRDKEAQQLCKSYN